MRKKKNENLKAAHMTISLPPSFLKAYRGRLSAITQRMMAEHTLGVTSNDFAKAYTVDARERRDPLEQELVRCARWVLESEILALRVRPEGVVINVAWYATGARTTLGIYGTTDGFLKVCYDRVLELDGRPVCTDAGVTGYETNLGGFKMAVLHSWCKRSPMLAVTDAQYEGGVVTSFRVTDRMSVVGV